MDSFVAVVIVLHVLAALVALYRHLFRFRWFFESQGIPVVPRTPWREYHTVDYKARDLQDHKKHGKMWGQYEGSKAFLFITDPEMLKEIFVKNFENFVDRQQFHVEEKLSSLIDARERNWKVIRKALSPTFTSGKLKGMTGTMDSVSDSMIAHLKREVGAGKTLDVKPVYQGLSLDTISNCAFGITTNSFENPNNELLEKCMASFTGLRLKNLGEAFTFASIMWFPFFERFIDSFGYENYAYLRNTTKGIADTRTEKRGDFIDKLNELRDDFKSGRGDKVLTEDLILAQGIGFFQAGFETSSNTLSTISYNLAKNPEIQERLHDEIQDVLSRFDGRIDHETVNEMELMEATINENLRICTPVTRLDRTCKNDIEIGGVLIKSGVVVQAPVYAIHHSPQHYTDPETFNPDRFLKDGEGDTNSFRFMAFGGGPRTCIGMRFAMIEVKIALAKLINTFRILDTPETKMETLGGDMFFFSYPEVRVRLEPRK